VSRDTRKNVAMTRIAIIGGGPGGYEAALVAVQYGAEVTLVEADGLGGSTVLTDCVPSKTLVATAEVTIQAAESAELGVVFGDGTPPDGVVGVHLGRVNARVKGLAQAQSDDIAGRLAAERIRVLRGTGRITAPGQVSCELAGDGTELVTADTILVATGARPRVLPGAQPDGERILSWEQLYELSELPERLVVVGSGVTGAEFASAYQALGSQVVLVSSRDRVLPGEDADAAGVLEEVFRRRGMEVLGRSRASTVTRTADGVAVQLVDGRIVEGTHCLLAVGSIPNTEGLGLAEAGVRLGKDGYIEVDRVSRTSAPGIYAAGDCTGVLLLASVAAMQGRIAMWHALGAAVKPLDLRTVAATVFTDPEIATVGYSERAIELGEVAATTVKLPLATNARAKMQGVRDGFIKLFCRPGTGIIVGGVVVAPRASELIHAVSLAVDASLTVEQVAHAFTVYPSVSGSIAEAARRLSHRETSGEV